MRLSRKNGNFIGVNDADYEVNTRIGASRVICPAYQAWKNMLLRCYRENRSKRDKTYEGASVCDEWLSFMSFRKWWLENYVEGWHLDKDLLTDNRQYSPENCIYVPAWLNTFTIDCGSARGLYPIGASFHKSSGLFRAVCSNRILGKQEHIGLFKTPDEAHAAWVSRKIKNAMSMKSEIENIDSRLYERVIEIINRAR